MERNLFWARIMKEHAIFIESAIPPLYQKLALQARQFKQQLSVLLAETIRLSDGAVTAAALQSGQYYTRYTEAAEQAVKHLTGLDTDSALTQSTYDIKPAALGSEGPPEDAVRILNTQLLNIVRSLAAFKSDLYNSQTSCRIFTFLYPADLAHVLHEAMHYIGVLTALENRDERVRETDRPFWTENMGDHAKSMRGLFDPTEIHYFNEANRFAQVFDALAAEPASPRVLPETQNIALFKADTTQALLECKVRSLMNPLFTDHLLREANHFTYQLER